MTPGIYRLQKITWHRQSTRLALTPVLSAGLLVAQQGNPSPLVRGVLIARGGRPAGEFSVRRR